MGKRALWIGLAAVLLVAGAGFYVYSQQPKGGGDASEKSAPAAKGKKGFDPNRATPVVADVAKKGDVNLYLNGLGTVVPLRTVTVRSRVDGELMAVHFNEGQVVKAGDLLAEIDPRPFQVMLMQAEGQQVRDQALLAYARI